MSWLKNIFGVDGKLFEKIESVVGVEIGTSSIKVVQLKKKLGKAVLETYGEIALGPYAGLEVGQPTNLPEEKIVEAMIDLLRESHVTTRACALSIPYGASLVTLLELPKVSDKELAAMIPLEARRYIPVPIGEVSLDWWVVPSIEGERDEPEEEEEKKPKNDGKQPLFGQPIQEQASNKPLKKIDVMVVAIHNDTLTRYRNIVKQAGLDAKFLELEIFSTIRAIIRNDMSLLAVVDFSAGNTKISIVERGVLRESHIVNRGSQDITQALSRGMGITVRQAEELKRRFGLGMTPEGKEVRDTALLTTDYIFSEINRVLLNYEKKHERVISKVVFTGAGATINGFIDEAKKNIEAEVVGGDPFSKVEAPAFLETILKEVGPDFAVSVGLALRALQE